ncbi:MAG TPA: hypothetical protein VFB04_14925 [Terriglobales bacterium]|nr:hypothetical protein [Terriglobales bacterium]
MSKMLRVLIAMLALSAFVVAQQRREGPPAQAGPRGEQPHNQATLG